MVSAAGKTVVRLAPLAEDEWSPEVRRLLGGSWLAEAPPKPSPVRATFARHLRMFERWDALGAVLFNGELPARDREVLILRAAWLSQCEPQWAHHDKQAILAGLTRDDIAAIVEGPDAPALAECDRVLVKATDQLRERGRIDDSTWTILASRYPANQLMEIPMVVGFYTMNAYALNSFGTPKPDDLPGLPPRDA